MRHKDETQQGRQCDSVETAGKVKFRHTNRCYKHKAESALENETNKLLRDFEMQKDRLISGRRPDLIIISKKRDLQNCGLCCPG